MKQTHMASTRAYTSDGTSYRMTNPNATNLEIDFRDLGGFHTHLTLVLRLTLVYDD